MILSQDETSFCINTIRKALPDVQGIYLYGSGATDQFTDESDIDLAYHCLPKARVLTVVEEWELAASLAAKLLRNVDLVNLGAAHHVLQMEVIWKGKRLYSAKEDVSEFWETTYSSMYLQYQDDMKAVKDGIYERGHIR
ncbi:type VII toxin-antitoxin system MntA family adenylyltransferase antitoxin [Marinoscillum furvescens]|uniref:Putative nucleotidyltransferase n=1 Tax=Marinoscillum furvescens DSM 4134 TaxID=1122208 RepID=A0A3D9L5K5_MARFU|nr:nucleotidyltransferase domain-containing protein [Marinoscillum furvescens]REE00556.1 putative nucleotidyltransferase [Marinoscillum furvescens DSM 4134]